MVSPGTSMCAFIPGEDAYLEGSSWIVVDGTVAESEMQMKYAMKTPTIDYNMKDPQTVLNCSISEPTHPHLFVV